MGRPPKLKDPVEDSSKEKHDSDVEEAVGTLDPESGHIESALDKVEQEMVSSDAISISDFNRVPAKAARYIHPFEGYALAPSIEVGKNSKGEPVEVSRTMIVALDPKVDVYQDPSNKGVTIGTGAKSKIVNLENFHARMIRDLERGGQNNIEVVFDRKIVTAEGQTICYAVIPQHGVRAQLVFTMDPKNGQIKADPRYLLMDSNQMRPLRRLFMVMYGPQLKNLRMAEAISEGDSDALDSMLTQKEI